MAASRDPQSTVEDLSRTSEAVVVWSGWGETPTPARDEGRLVARYGEAEAAELLVHVRAWEDAFFESDARLRAGGTQEMGELAERDFRVRYPGASDDAVHALGWCYTWDFK